MWRARDKLLLRVSTSEKAGLVGRAEEDDAHHYRVGVRLGTDFWLLGSSCSAVPLAPYCRYIAYALVAAVRSYFRRQNCSSVYRGTYWSFSTMKRFPAPSSTSTAFRTDCTIIAILCLSPLKRSPNAHIGSNGRHATFVALEARNKLLPALRAPEVEVSHAAAIIRELREGQEDNKRREKV